MFSTGFLTSDFLPELTAMENTRIAASPNPHPVKNKFLSVELHSIKEAHAAAAENITAVNLKIKRIMLLISTFHFADGKLPGQKH
jgi:hypothetical protein